jgi:hypothetical protein
MHLLRWISCILASAASAGPICFLLLDPEPQLCIGHRFDRIVFAAREQAFITTRDIGSPNEAGGKPLQDRIAELALWEGTAKAPTRIVKMPRTAVTCVACSDGKIAVLAVGRDEMGKWFCSVYMFGVGEFTEEFLVTSIDWKVLSELRTVFFAKNGDLLGISQTKDGLSYEIWDLCARRRICTDTMPLWIRGASALLQDQIDRETMRMNRRLDGNWDGVLRELYPAHRPGNTLTLTEPICVASECDTLLRIPFRSKGTIEVYDIAKGSRRDLIYPKLQAEFLRASPNCDTLIVSSCITRVATRLDQVRSWFRCQKPILEQTKGLTLIRGADAEEIRRFPGAEDAFYSVTGATVAVVFPDRTEIWKLPLSAPWTKIFAICLCISLCILALHKALDLLCRRWSRCLPTNVSTGPKTT